MAARKKRLKLEDLDDYLDVNDPIILKTQPERVNKIAIGKKVHVTMPTFSKKLRALQKSQYDAHKVSKYGTIIMDSGEILKIDYDKGTINSASTAVTTITFTGEQLDSKDVNGAAKASTYPCVARAGASAGDNKWVNFVVNGTCTITVASGAASKIFYVYIYYR